MLSNNRTDQRHIGNVPLKNGSPLRILPSAIGEIVQNDNLQTRFMEELRRMTAYETEAACDQNGHYGLHPPQALTSDTYSHLLECDILNADHI